jgi:hypothetical protein
MYAKNNFSAKIIFQELLSIFGWFFQYRNQSIKKNRGMVMYFFLIENLSHAIKPLNNTFFPVRNLKFKLEVRFFKIVKIIKTVFLRIRK